MPSRHLVTLVVMIVAHAACFGTAVTGDPWAPLMKRMVDGDDDVTIARVRRSPIYTGYFPSRPRGKLRAIPASPVDGGGDALIVDGDEILVTSAQTLRGPGRAASRRNSQPGFSGTVADGKSTYVTRFNQGVPVYGAGEPYYFSYTHNFPIGVNEFESLVNSHNLPKKYKFSGSLDVTGLLN